MPFIIIASLHFRRAARVKDIKRTVSSIRSFLRANSGAFRRGAASIALRVSGVVLTFAATILLARFLGPSKFGAYSFSLALATLISVFAQLGVPTLIVREAAIYRTREKWQQLKGMIFLLLAVVLAGSLTLMLIFGVLVTSDLQFMSRFDKATTLFALGLIPLFALNNAGGGALRGLGFVIKGQLADQIIRPAFLLIGLIVVVVVSDAGLTDPDFAMSIHLGAALLAFLFGMAFLVRSLPAEFGDYSGEYSDWGVWRKSILPLTVLAGLQIINGQTDILMLGVLRHPEEVGVYRVAHQGATMVNMTLFAIGLTVQPAIAGHFAKRNLQELQSLVRSTGRMAFALSAVFTTVLIAFGMPIIELVFGPEYIGAYRPLVLLCLGQIGLAYAGWAVLMLNMTGHERLTVKFTAVAAVANIIANSLLIPPFGVLGAALATASTIFAWKLGMAIVAEKTTGIRTIIYPTKVSSVA